MSLRILLLPVAAAISLAAGPRPFDLERSHSEINFVANARLLDAHGFFDTFTVVVAFDPDSVVNSTVTIEIDAQSINTRNSRRDRHLRSCDFFCVDSFPKITFQSERVTRVGPDRYRIDGTFTMRGVTRPMSVPARMVFNEGGSARFNGEFDLDRTDFGVSYSGVGNPIADTVHVAFNFTLRDPAARRSPPPPPRAQ